MVVEATQLPRSMKNASGTSMVVAGVHMYRNMRSLMSTFLEDRGCQTTFERATEEQAQDL